MANAAGTLSFDSPEASILLERVVGSLGSHVEYNRGSDSASLVSENSYTESVDRNTYENSRGMLRSGPDP